MTSWRYLYWQGLVLALLLMLPRPVSSQTLGSGLLQGIVTDSLGAPINEAIATATNLQSGLARSGTTGQDGRFRIALLPPGDYSLLVEGFGYVPRRVEGIAVRAGQQRDVPVTLTVADDIVDQADVVHFQAGQAGRILGAGGRDVSRSDIAGFPFEHREFTELARLSSVWSGAALEFEGLPSRLSGLAVDGVPSIRAAEPYLGSVLFPLHTIERAEILLNPADVEWSGFAGGLLAGHTRAGARTFAAEGYGTWGGGPLADSPVASAEASPSDALAGLILSGPLLRDGIRFSAGVRAHRFERPVSPTGTGNPLPSDLSEIARDSFGVDLSEYASPRLARSEAISAFGRVDWQIASRNALTVRGNFAAIPSMERVDASPVSGAPGPASEGSELSVAAILTSRLGDVLGSELRIGFGSGTRDYDGAIQELRDAGLPGTTFLPADLRLGDSFRPRGRSGHSAFRVSETLYYPWGSHRLKVGAAALIAAYDRTNQFGEAGEFVFGGAAELAAGRGSFVQQIGGSEAAEFTARQYALYLQDTWTVVQGLDLLLGVRYEWEDRPRSEVSLNQLWLQQTGLRNDAAEASRAKLSPRFSVTWDVGRRQQWVLRAAAGIFHDLVDPEILAEWIGNNGSVQIRRGVGVLGTWPTPPGGPVATITGARLTVLGPGFDAPRSARSTIGVTRRFGSLGNVHLSGTYRRTDFLPRRRNLNLPPLPAAFDQYGRPLYGTLAKQGALLTAVPMSNQRFSSWDRVDAVNADGHSDYVGMTVAMDRSGRGPLDLFASYTWSQTRDNWLGARADLADAQFTPFPDSLDGRDWTDGRSDFDLPHRLVLGAELDLPIALSPRVAALYRFRSGYPFTPGFQRGTDANADGSSWNDPAYIDPDIPGVSQLIGEWACLRDQTGRFAERNACRAPGVHSLDLRAEVGVIRTGRYSADVIVEGLNLIGSKVGERDHALYLVEQGRALIRAPGSAEVMVPLIANPEFGGILVERTPPRALRLGVQLRY